MWDGVHITATRYSPFVLYGLCREALLVTDSDTSEVAEDFPKALELVGHSTSKYYRSFSCFIMTIIYNFLTEIQYNQSALLRSYLLTGKELSINISTTSGSTFCSAILSFLVAVNVLFGLKGSGVAEGFSMDRLMERVLV